MEIAALTGSVFSGRQQFTIVVATYHVRPWLIGAGQNQLISLRFAVHDVGLGIREGRLNILFGLAERATNSPAKTSFTSQAHIANRCISCDAIDPGGSTITPGLPTWLARLDQRVRALEVLGGDGAEALRQRVRIRPAT